MTRTEYFIARAKWHEAEARELRRLAALEQFSSSMDGFIKHPVYTEFQLPNFGRRVVPVYDSAGTAYTGTQR